MYAASFVAIQLLHLTLATKQPAMTAPAMAARLRDIKSDAAVDDFVDEVADLVRSQVAAVLGNVLVVVPTVAAIALLAQLALERPLLDAAHAAATLKSLSLAGPTALFAAITGILLFSASIIAGWTENAFVLHRLDSAMRYNPRIGAFLAPHGPAAGPISCAPTFQASPPTSRWDSCSAAARVRGFLRARAGRAARDTVGRTDRRRGGIHRPIGVAAACAVVGGGGDPGHWRAQCEREFLLRFPPGAARAQREPR